MRRWLVGAAFASVVAIALPVAADPTCGASARPIVELVLEVEPPDRIIGTTLHQHLQAELSAREIELCMQPFAERRPITRVSLHVDRPPRGPVTAVIRIDDLVTDKRVERTIDLSRLPADSRPLAVAAAVDELLRASWAELTITDAPKAVEAPPLAVVRAVEVSSRPRPPLPSVLEVGVVATASDFFGHRTALGGEVWIGAWVFPRWALQIRFGADGGLARTSAHGTARADVLAAGAGLAFSPIDPDARFGVRFEAGASLLRVRVAGDAIGAAIADEAWQWSATADATARGWARTGPLFWNLGIGATAALRPVRATDDGATVTSIEGGGVKITAGVAFHFH